MNTPSAVQKIYFSILQTNFAATSPTHLTKTSKQHDPTRSYTASSQSCPARVSLNSKHFSDFHSLSVSSPAAFQSVLLWWELQYSQLLAIHLGNEGVCRHKLIVSFTPRPYNWSNTNKQDSQEKCQGVWLYLQGSAVAEQVERRTREGGKSLAKGMGKGRRTTHLSAA